MSKDEKLRFSSQLRRGLVVKHLEDVLIFDLDPVGAEDHPVLAVRHDCHDAHLRLRVVLLREVLGHVHDEVCRQVELNANLKMTLLSFHK